MKEHNCLAQVTVGWKIEDIFNIVREVLSGFIYLLYNYIYVYNYLFVTKQD